LINLSSFDEAGRTALANQLLTPLLSGSSTQKFDKNTNKKVLRHLRNGDFLLLNRQPTLHKPSIMAHTARILPGEKTIRMHYANCNTYNADFDGDEMNIHFPQNEIARAEAMLIARNDLQYLVPTDGGVLRGLIQDHVDAGVGMCSRDSFFTREEYMQLIYCGLAESNVFSSVGNGNIEDQVIIGRDGQIVTLAPAIIKPCPLWTGKQVISTILENITPPDRDFLNLKSTCKIPAEAWGPSAPEERGVLIMDGQLLTGILDKSQFGASSNGLVHAVYEVYGPKYAGKLLSILGRLFTSYLQFKGFTCRMDDLMLNEKGDKIRRKIIDKSLRIGLEAALECTGLEHEGAELSLELEKIQRNSERTAQLDSAMKARTGGVTSNIIAECVPARLLKPFPKNNMQVMTVSGAKGSPVNVSQISCLLGQQELEGKRVPTMISGKTLPLFLPYDSSAAAGGFITGRFLTGIKPHEYYFHCMAGREGLIDTAVKTSRSGYLQRCLVKHLEGLRVHYDHTVRDSDGSVIQFHYGEDSLDILKQTTLENFEFNALNYQSFLKRFYKENMDELIDESTIQKIRKKEKKTKTKIYNDPFLAEFSPSRYIGSVSEKFEQHLAEFISSDKSYLLSRHGESEERKEWSGERIPYRNFKTLMLLKYMHSIVDPGEAVGLLAAQSVGEPSTQMTLNTFHFAGFGAKNVTLGIPRLREIVMTASANIKTPLMKLVVKDGLSEDKVKSVVKMLDRLTLSNLVQGVSVVEKIQKVEKLNQKCKVFHIAINFGSAKQYQEEFKLKKASLAEVLQTKLIIAIDTGINRVLKGYARNSGVEDIKVGKILGATHFQSSNPRNDYDSGEDEAPEEDSRRNKKEEIANFEDPDEEDELIIDIPDEPNEQDEKNDRESEETIIDKSKYCDDFYFDGSECKFNVIVLETNVSYPLIPKSY
jgi:DNA-directed RNA polymerase I subunit RPA1